jgi:DNA modification methylase
VVAFDLHTGDSRKILNSLPEKSVHCVVCSPPYFNLRDYGAEHTVWNETEGCSHQWMDTSFRNNNASGGQVKKTSALQATSKGSYVADYNDRTIKAATCSVCAAWKGCLGLEPSVDIFVDHLLEVFKGVKRVLRDDGVLWVNLGDTFDSKTKNLLMVPAEFALSMKKKGGWILRSEVIWNRPNALPSSVKDRPNVCHEHIFMFVKQKKYFYDRIAVMEPAKTTSKDATVPTEMRNLRTVWTIPTQPSLTGHHAAYPGKLVEPCIRSSTSEKGCCITCGAPVQRVVETNNPSAEFADYDNIRDWSSTLYPSGNPQSSKSLHRQGGGVYSTAVTTGWVPTCNCYDEDYEASIKAKDVSGIPLNPCTVMDVFSGSGTTGVQALECGRSYVGIELNGDYAQSSATRLSETRDKVIGLRPIEVSKSVIAPTIKHRSVSGVRLKSLF